MSYIPDFSIFSHLDTLPRPENLAFSSLGRHMLERDQVQR